MPECNRRTLGLLGPLLLISAINLRLWHFQIAANLAR